MAGFAHDIAGGAGALIASFFKSPNFIEGVQGWEVTRTGDAEFNNVTVRGVIAGIDFEINNNGIFFYAPG